jgi:hypothetical protein
VDYLNVLVGYLLVDCYLLVDLCMLSVTVPVSASGIFLVRFWN